jgi:phage tail-like protein
MPYNFSQMATDPIRNFRYIVQFSKVADFPASVGPNFKPAIGFASVSGLGVSVDPIAYREGGYNTYMHYLPGQSSFTPITLTRGQTLGGTQHRDWLKSIFAVVQASSRKSSVGNNFRCDVDITVLSHPNPNRTSNMSSTTSAAVEDMHASMKIRVYNAWITSLAYGDLSASGNGLMVEGMSLIHEGFEVEFAKDYAVTASKPGNAGL